MNVTQRVAEHLVDVQHGVFEETVIRRAKMRLLDAVGNIVAGQRARGNDAVADLVIGWGGAAQSTVYFRGAAVPTHNAAMINALMMRSYDFESVGAEAAGEVGKAAHISGTTIPVALAMGERLHASGRDVLTALLVGDDIAARLGVASGFHTASGGDNTGTVNALGSVAICGKLLGFRADQYLNGMGIALNQISGTVANLFDRAESFKLPQANSARNAVFSAELAEVGFTGPIDAIGGRFGFFDLYSPEPAPEKLLAGLGVEFNADMIIKPWSSCRAAHPALDAALRVHHDHAVDASEIVAVRVHVTPTTERGFTGQAFTAERNPEVAGMFSIRYNVAVGLVHGDFRPEHLQDSIMSSPTVRGVLERIDIVGSLAPTEYQTAEIEVDLVGGRTIRVRTDAPLGDIYRNPLDESQIREKFDLNVAFGGSLTPTAADRVAEMIDRFDELDDITELVSLLV